MKSGENMLLGIYGAGGLGREILILAQQINDNANRWNDFLFIDDTVQISKVKNIRTITFDKAKSEYDNTCLEFVVAVGEPYSRKMLREKICNEDFSLATLVHPTVCITDGSKLGAGATICNNCFVSCDVTIGDNVLLQPSVNIGHDSQIGMDTVISSFVCVAGDCVIGAQTYIGMNVPIKEHVQIGTQTIVGMGSVVTKDIPDQVIALGNPARAMKRNEDHKVF